MARADGRIEIGQPIRGAISARAWNRAQDAADIVLGSHLSVSASQGFPAGTPYTEALLKNNTGGDVSPFTGVPCSGFIGSDSYTASPGSMTLLPKMSSLVLNGSVSSGVLDVDQPWCVALEPIKSGDIGRVAVSGVVQFALPGGGYAGNYVSKQGESREVGLAQVLFDTNGTFGLINLGKSNYTFTTLTNQAWPRYTQWTTLYGITAANALYDVKSGERVIISKLFNYALGKMQWSLISAHPAAFA